MAVQFVSQSGCRAQEPSKTTKTAGLLDHRAKDVACSVLVVLV